LLTVSKRGNGISRPRAPAYATWSLIALTLLAYLIQFVADETRASEIVLRYGVTPEIFVGGERPFGDFPPLLTPLTAIFLHGSWDHLAGNMIYLWVFGDEIEEVLGPFRFVLLYLVSGVCGALGYIAIDNHATIVLLGASGSVSGVIAAYLMLRPCEPVTIGLPGRDARRPLRPSPMPEARSAARLRSGGSVRAGRDCFSAATRSMIPHRQLTDTIVSGWRKKDGFPPAATPC
jgi:membrane associated rhomboid family serine protease